MVLWYHTVHKQIMRNPLPFYAGGPDSYNTHHHLCPRALCTISHQVFHRKLPFAISCHPAYMVSSSLCHPHPLVSSLLQFRGAGKCIHLGRFANGPYLMLPTSLLCWLHLAVRSGQDICNRHSLITPIK